MPRHVVTIVGAATLVMFHASLALAQSPKARTVLVGQQASAREGRVHGRVRDDAGRAITGVSVLAVGGTALPVMARSDESGQFVLALPPGEYILRATRDGYVSTYASVRIQAPRPSSA